MGELVVGEWSVVEHGMFPSGAQCGGTNGVCSWWENCNIRSSWFSQMVETQMRIIVAVLRPNRNDEVVRVRGR